jgi:hypothetical protein
MLQITQKEASILLENISKVGINVDPTSEVTEQEADALVDKLYEFCRKEDTWLTRLEQERTELFTKLCKLHEFTLTEAFKKLPAVDQDLLQTQYCSMFTYHSILSMRYYKAKKDSQNV